MTLQRYYEISSQTAHCEVVLAFLALVNDDGPLDNYNRFGEWVALSKATDGGVVFG